MGVAVQSPFRMRRRQIRPGIGQSLHIRAARGDLCAPWWRLSSSAGADLFPPPPSRVSGRGFATNKFTSIRLHQPMPSKLVVLVDVNHAVLDVLERWLLEAGYDVVSSARFED